MYRGLFLFDVSFAIIAVQETFPGEQGKHKTLAQESCSWVEESNYHRKSTSLLRAKAEGRRRAYNQNLRLVIWHLFNRLMYQIFVNHNIVENRKGKKHKSSQRSEGLSYELTETV